MGDGWDALLEEEAEPSTSKIPMDLFVSKKQRRLTRGHLSFADSSGDILYQMLNPIPNSPHKRSFLVVDAAQNPLLSVHPNPKKSGSWLGYRGSDGEELVFRVQRTVKKLARTELEVFLVGESENAPDFKVRGCPFQRSCTIYKDDSIVAQTSLMHKLRQLFVIFIGKRPTERSNYLLTAVNTGDLGTIARIILSEINLRLKSSDLDSLKVSSSSDV